MVRVRNDRWKSEFAGMRGIIQRPLVSYAHGAVEVLLEDGRLRSFWLSDLSMVD